ncbi:MAG: hypothetical protein AAFU79_24045, partial [Myxococcota bacterium]
TVSSPNLDSTRFKNSRNTIPFMPRSSSAHRPHGAELNPIEAVRLDMKQWRREGIYRPIQARPLSLSGKNRGGGRA